MSKNNQSTAVYIFKIVYPLVVICALIALLVAGVNKITKPVIDEQTRTATNQAINDLFADIAKNGAVGDTETTDEAYIIPEEHIKVVDAIYPVYDGSLDGEFLGYCAVLSPSGFKGEVNLIAAFDTEGYVIGVDVTATNDETADYGTRVNEPSEGFEAQFIETKGEKELPAEMTNDFILAGATKTSKPVAQSVFTAKKLVANIISAKAVPNDVNETEKEVNEE